MMYYAIMYARIELRVSEENDCLKIEIPYEILDTYMRMKMTS